MSDGIATMFEPDHPGAVVLPSPNFGARIGVERPDIILLHYTGMRTGEGAEQRLRDPTAEVSSHYLVHEDGRIVQMVRETDRAWHAGKSSWCGQTDINSRSVGIEIVNPGHEHGYRPFPEAQMDAVVALCLGIQARHGIAATRVLGHSDVAPGRKVDPGELFDWKRLAGHGLAVYVEPSPISEGPVLAFGDAGPEVRTLQNMLSLIGYGAPDTGEFDETTQKAVGAFQLRFRPALVDGRADKSTLETLRNLSEKVSRAPTV